MSTPLAEKMRPNNFSDFVGQTHITKGGAIIGEIIRTKQPVSLILWGPPGCGKTTLARVIARELDVFWAELSATSTKKSDITKLISDAKKMKQNGQQMLLFIDEIHRFSKAQQDTFLPHIESGVIVLLGATTENPSFEIINALLSRCRVVVFEAHRKQDIVTILSRAVAQENAQKRIDEAALDYIAEYSCGDARIALSTLELALKVHSRVNISLVKKLLHKPLPRYDAAGDEHYFLVSAFIKSMRASQLTASLYYLARMLQAGEDPKFIARRMVVFASEDIGLAGNGALSLAVATFHAVSQTGMPESKYMLFHCATALTKSKKSRDVANLAHRAMQLAELHPNVQVPLHLRNASTQLAEDLGYQNGMQWDVDFIHPEGYLPKQIINEDIEAK
jgi:putative ATPase